MSNTLMSGTTQKAAGDEIRLSCDFGDISTLVDGASVVDGVLVMSVNIADYDITATGLTVVDLNLDFPYVLSGRFSGGAAGTTYSCVFWIQLDDDDATEISRTGPLKVL